MNKSHIAIFQEFDIPGPRSYALHFLYDQIICEKPFLGDNGRIDGIFDLIKKNNISFS